jgi:hypothetical protein
LGIENRAFCGGKKTSNKRAKASDQAHSKGEKSGVWRRKNGTMQRMREANEYRTMSAAPKTEGREGKERGKRQRHSSRLIDEGGRRDGGTGAGRRDEEVGAAERKKQRAAKRNWAHSAGERGVLLMFLDI